MPSSAKWKLTKTRNLAGCCLLLCASFRLSAQHGNNAPDTFEPVREFVQSFYDWYVPRALSANSAPAWIVAISQKSSLFSSPLASALKEDFAAQDKSPGSIVGLDFDPFLDSQDPADRYEVGRIFQSGDHYRAEVYSVSSGKKSDKADVVVELSGSAGHWVFLNFHYEQGKDLLALLRSLRKKREKHAPDHEPHSQFTPWLVGASCCEAAS